MTSTVTLVLTEAEAAVVRSALRNTVTANENTLDSMRSLSLKRASEPVNQRIADDAATRIVVARTILERMP